MRILILLAMSAACSSAEGPDACEDSVARQSWDDRTSPVYAEAMELGMGLSAHGFRVNCIRRSKEETLFKGQKGAAWFSTDQGIFEAWFLPKPKSFERLEAISQPDGSGGFNYSFRGTPRIAITMGSSKFISFIPHGSVMFKVWGDEQLAANLRQAFSSP